MNSESKVCEHFWTVLQDRATCACGEKISLSVMLQIQRLTLKVTKAQKLLMALKYLRSKWIGKFGDKWACVSLADAAIAEYEKQEPFLEDPREEERFKPFRKRQLIVEAFQFDCAQDSPACVKPWPCPEGYQPRDMSFGYIDTLEGRMHVHHGDWIVKGIKGEFYPVKDEIFRATYEPVAPEI